jgi:MFS family permease
MSHDHLTVPKPETFESRNLNRVLLGLLGIGVSSLVVTLLIGFVAPAGSELRRQFAFSWLFAFLYFFTILIGCFFWLLVHHATDSGWGIVVRRQMENLATLLPWMVLFFLPLFLFRRDIWDWIAAKDSPVIDPHLRDKLGYFELHFGSLVIPFFWIRAILYFAFFGFGPLYFRRTSFR